MHITLEIPDYLNSKFNGLQNAQQFLQQLLITSLELDQDQKVALLKNIEELTVDTSIVDVSDPWNNTELDFPSVDTGIVDLALNHDHYLYGVLKHK